MQETAATLKQGANEYFLKLVEIVGGLLLVVAILVVAFAEKESGTYYVTFAFIWGATTALAAAYLSLIVALKVNVLTAKMANESLG